MSKIHLEKPGYSRQASFDVTSLFTNVPVKEAVDLAMEMILNDDDSRCFLHAMDLHKLFEYATSYCNFQFDGQDYDQIDGLSMGNPLAPPLAHYFMAMIEEKALNQGLLRPLMWLRYVDDVYVRLSKRDFDQIEDIRKRLNSVHPAIQFTSEIEKGGSLNFLDVKCGITMRKNGKYTTSVYKKPTNTNLYIRWDSAHPESQKLGTFYCLLNNYKKIHFQA